MRTKPIKELSIDQISDRFAIMDPHYRKYYDSWGGQPYDLLEEYTHRGIDRTFDELDREFREIPDFVDKGPVYRQYCHQWLDTAKPYDKEDRPDVIAKANKLDLSWGVFWDAWACGSTATAKTVSDFRDVRSIPKAITKR